ncbi:MAG: hypothetical protein AABZ34_04760 [Nitrospirota bacterium]
MLDLAKTIWEVGKEIFGIRGDLQKAQRDRRDRLANYFSELAELIESVSASLKIKQYPHGSCAQLHTLAQLMQKTLRGLVESGQAREFQDRLMRVWEIEQLFSQLQSKSDSVVRKRLIELDEAAGFFRATAAHLRVV